MISRDDLKIELLRRNYQELQVFTGAFVDHARRGPRIAVDLALTGDAETRPAARAVVEAIGDLAIDPLLDAPAPELAADRVWRLERLVEADRELREKIVRLLDRMLDDKTPLPKPTFSTPVEGFIPSLRVCDRAYEMMRAIELFGESHDDPSYYRYFYTQLPFPNRDAEIERARASGNWKRDLTPKDVEDAWAAQKDGG